VRGSYILNGYHWRFVKGGGVHTGACLHFVMNPRRAAFLG
jgi:hypothetical protein